MTWPGPGPAPEPQLVDGQLWGWASRVYVDAVARMRQLGMTWAEIEAYLGMAPGSGERAYGPLLAEEASGDHDLPGAGLRDQVRDDAEDG